MSIYRISIFGYGGETVIGSLPNSAKYWKENEDDFEEYMFAWEEDLDNLNIDKEYDFRRANDEFLEWYDFDDICHTNGASRDNAWIVVEEVDAEGYDGKVIKEVLRENDLKEWLEETQSDRLEKDEVYHEYLVGDDIEKHIENSDSPYLIFAMSVEKGGFFDGTISIDGEFDPRKLSFDVDMLPSDDELITGVNYDGEEIPNDGGDTTGKAMVAKIWKW